MVLLGVGQLVRSEESSSLHVGAEKGVSNGEQEKIGIVKEKWSGRKINGWTPYHPSKKKLDLHN